MSRKEQTRRNITKKENILKILRIFLIAALTIIIFYPPYLQGLYFEKHVLPTQIIVFTVFIIFLIYKWLKNDNTPFFKTPLEYVCLGFVIVYFISIFAAVHTRSAITEWLKYCMYFAVFYMVSDLADTLKTKRIFLWTIVISAVGVSIIGLDAALGGNIVGILNKFFNVLGVKGSVFFGLFEANRIQSTLQYPNALASYLMAVFFVIIGLLITYDKLWQKVILGSFSFILFLTFMLTESRWAQLLFPLVVIILLMTAPKNYRINAVTHVIALAIPSVVISLFLFPYLSEDTFSIKVLSLLILGLIVTVIISIFVKFIGECLQKIDWRVYIVIISVFILISGIGLFYIINQSVPVELSIGSSEEDKVISIAKDVALKPNTDYILSFEAEAVMKEEKPYVFFVRLFNKNINNILFYGSEQLIRRDFPATDGLRKFELLFTTKEDTKLINVNFSIFYSGTSLKINSASIIDAKTGKTVKKIILKNRYNLDSVIARFQNILLQRSLVTRTIFYKDGIKIFKDRWFLGAGGGAWNYLYRQYQSYNYASSQAHNYPLQLGIETGILGIITLISLIIILIIYYSMYHKKVKRDNNSAFIVTAIAGLFLHAVIDFDFAECSILLLFWSLIALFNNEIIESLDIEDIKLLNLKVSKRREKFSFNEKYKSSITIGIVISMITLYLSLRFYIASSNAKQSFEYLQNNDFETAIDKMEKAINLDKYNEKYVIGYNPISSRPDIKAGFTDILFMKNEKFRSAQKNGENISEKDLSLFQKQFLKAASYIEKLEKKAENNISLTSDLASYCLKIGEIDKGIHYLNMAISYFPFEPSLWHSKVNVYYQLMKDYFNNEDYEKAKEYLISGLNVINEAKEINQNNMNPFVFNEDTVELIQTMKFLKDNWDTDGIYDVNNIVYYSIIDLDVNMDGIPDQWRISNEDLMNVTVDNDKLSIKASGRAYLYTRYPIKFKEGKKYRVEVDINEDREYLYFYVAGITSDVLHLNKEDNKYVAEFKVKGEPDENGNQARIYVDSDCEIRSILVKEIE